MKIERDNPQNINKKKRKAESQETEISEEEAYKDDYKTTYRRRENFRKNLIFFQQSEGVCSSTTYGRISEKPLLPAERNTSKSVRNKYPDPDLRQYLFDRAKSTSQSLSTQRSKSGQTPKSDPTPKLRKSTKTPILPHKTQPLITRFTLSQTVQLSPKPINSQTPQKAPITAILNPPTLIPKSTPNFPRA